MWLIYHKVVSKQRTEVFTDELLISLLNDMFAIKFPFLSVFTIFDGFGLPLLMTSRLKIDVGYIR